jgi:hypothetical protein
MNEQERKLHIVKPVIVVIIVKVEVMKKKKHTGCSQQISKICWDGFGLFSVNV